MEHRLVDASDGVSLHVGVHGSGPDVLVLSGGPGCVHYLADGAIAPRGVRSWYPEPRGVGRSGGGPHDLARAVADLEDVRRTVGVERWLVLGHSWGSDLAVRYALDAPSSVAGVIGVAGHGLHKDRTWSAVYEHGKATETPIDIPWNEDVWRALQASFLDWIHESGLLRALADSTVPMTFIAAGNDIRPSWPLQQLAALVPDATFAVVEGVPHDFWSTHPDVWRATVSESCAAMLSA